MDIEVLEIDDLEKIEKALKRDKSQDKDEIVRNIINDVRLNGDEALFGYTLKFDNFNIGEANMKVSKEEFEEADRSITEKEKKVISYSKERIEHFHRASVDKSFFTEENGIILGTRVTPVKRAGLYIPGGKAAYPSTALMTIIPAVVAGVDEIIITTPTVEGKVNPYVLYTAKLCGVDSVYKIGGAQAIAAMAYGTQSIKRVNVIAGPGNIYVATAKKYVYGDVGIDSVAGPSEIAIVADEFADVKFLAHDLLSQAEHDEMAMCYFIGLNRKIVDEVKKLFFELASSTPRASIAKKSAANAVFIYTKNRELAALSVDEIAPEHLELQISDPYMFMNKIRNAGAIFMGHYTPEAIGDYIAGPNHTLPTSQTAKFLSPLSPDVFMKKSNIMHYSKDAFMENAQKAADFAEMEGLFAHRSSIEVRFD